MKIIFLKFIDKYFGSIAIRFFSQYQLPCYTNPPQSFLLIRPGGIGDAVLLIPAIQSLRKAYPSSKIDVLAEKRNSAIFDLVTDIHNVYLYDTLTGLPSVLRNRYDVVIDTEQWYRLSAVIARLISAPMKIGFSTNERKKLFTHTVDYSLDDYEVYSFLKLLQPLNIDIPEERVVPFLNIPKEATLVASSLFAKIPRPLVAFFPGSSVPEKCWGKERFISLAARLSSQGISVVIIGGREDAAIGDEIAKGVAGLNFAGKTSLAETAAIIASVDLLVSGDSGLLHIASSLNTPTVSFFGPSSSAKWAPRGALHRVVEIGCSCSPCSLYGTIPSCPNGLQCMAGITVDMVMEAIDKLLVGGKIT